MFKTGELVIIPIGFRCYTSQIIRKKLAITQATLPFSIGFFSPQAIVNILKNKKVHLSYPATDNNHCVAKKYERYNDDTFGYGIKFISASYAEINDLAKNKTQKNINQLLDSTFGYYTIDLKNKFVLAHYNWHIFADVKKSNGIYDIGKNLQLCTDNLNRRIERMFTICNQAKYIILAYYNNQHYKYICIDNEVYPLDNFDIVVEEFQKNFKAKIFLINLEDENFLKNIILK